LFDEIFRVLKKGGRAVISDIVSDEDVPEHLQNDAELWSGCISGALTEEGFLQAFSEAGFYGIQILKRDEQPWQTVEGIEFRAVTVEAFKGKQGPCFERNQAVIYRGPFREVLDDDNHRMERGVRYAVCDKTYNLYRKAPYRDYFEFIEPRVDIFVRRGEAFRLFAHRAPESEGNQRPGLQHHDGGEQQLLRWRELLLMTRKPSACRNRAPQSGEHVSSGDLPRFPGRFSLAQIEMLLGAFAAAAVLFSIFKSARRLRGSFAAGWQQLSCNLFTLRRSARKIGSDWAQSCRHLRFSSSSAGGFSGSA
jgi:hypothetical protein